MKPFKPLTDAELAELVPNQDGRHDAAFVLLVADYKRLRDHCVQVDASLHVACDLADVRDGSTSQRCAALAELAKSDDK